MPYVVSHSAVGLRGRSAFQGEVLHESDLEGCDIDRLVNAGAIQNLGESGSAVPALTAPSSELEAAKAEIERLKAIAKEATELIAVLTDGELEEARKRVEAKKAKDADARTSFEAMKKDELLALCKEKAIDANAAMKKDDLIDLLVAASS